MPFCKLDQEKALIHLISDGNLKHPVSDDYPGLNIAEAQTYYGCSALQGSHYHRATLTVLLA